MAAELRVSQKAAPDPGLSIIDPHQHFWQLGHGHYPWLEEPVQISFRYGNYEADSEPTPSCAYARARARETKGEFALSSGF
jgi:hypothetical protein